MQHLDDCPHGRVDVAFDPGNWLPEDLTLAQINALIAEADARLDAPIVARALVPLHAPPVPPVLPLFAVAFGGILNPLNWIHGGRGRGGANADAGGADAHRDAPDPDGGDV
jgi:hypothetical protein